MGTRAARRCNSRQRPARRGDGRQRGRVRRGTVTVDSGQRGAELGGSGYARGTATVDSGQRGAELGGNGYVCGAAL